MELKIHIREMNEADIDQTARVHQEAFIRQKSSRDWILCNLNACPKTLCYVALHAGSVIGYIFWTQKSGFRDQVVLELEQIAVDPEYQGKGVGAELISASLPRVNRIIESGGSTIKHLMVTTRADNYAQSFYRNILGAQVEATIANLYSADEVVMVARNFDMAEALN